MKTLHLGIITTITIAVIGMGFALFMASTTTGKSSDLSYLLAPTQFDNNMITNANGGRPLDITMHVKDTNINGKTIPISNLPLTLKGGENITLEIEIVSQVPKPLSLQLRVFNNVENYQDLAFARVKFNGDASGLPSGLTASFGKDVVALNANGSDQETLTFVAGQTVKTGNYQIGVLGLTTINSSAGVEIGNSQTLWIPITIK